MKNDAEILTDFLIKKEDFETGFEDFIKRIPGDFSVPDFEKKLREITHETPLNPTFMKRQEGAIGLEIGEKLIESGEVKTGGKVIEKGYENLSRSRVVTPRDIQGLKMSPPIDLKRNPESGSDAGKIKRSLDSSTIDQRLRAVEFRGIPPWVEFHEEPVPAAGDGDSLASPEIESLHGGRIGPI